MSSSTPVFDLKNVLAELIRDGLVARHDAESMYIGTRTRERAEAHPLQLVAEQKWQSAEPVPRPLTIEVLMEWLARKTGLSYYHIDPLKIDAPKVCAMVSHGFATRYKILPVDVNTREVVIATANPYDREWEKQLEHATRLSIRRVVSNPQDIVRYLGEFYSLSRSLKGASKVQTGAGIGVASFEQLVELGKMGSLDANDQHIVTVVDWLLQYAYDQGASDIHLEPRRDSGNVRFRIDGVMHLVHQIPTAVLNAVTNRIKLLSRMDIVEKRRPQDGRIKTRTQSGEEIELRLSTMPTAFGEKLVLRIFNPEVLVKSFRELGFTDDEFATWEKLIAQPNGIILVTGPTGSGKTTTLYSILNYVNSEGVNIMTLEDPVEYPMAMIRQTNVHEAAKMDFANGIRSMMRQDPDIILVGEIRDHETAEMAFRAAMTGHQVYSTLHTNSAIGAIPRLLDIGVLPDIMAGNIIGVIAQRLVRKLCAHCKQPYQPDDFELRLLGLDPASAPPQLFQASGCEKCDHQGYRGRVAIQELLKMDSELDEMIARRASVREIRQAALQRGFRPLAEDAIRRVVEGVTSLDEISRVVDLTDRVQAVM